MGRLPKGFRHGPAVAPSSTAQQEPAQQQQQQQQQQQPPQQAEQSSSGSAKRGADARKQGPNPAFLKEAPATAVGAPAPPSTSAGDEKAGSGGDDDATETSGPETRGQMIRRHKLELQALKKNLPRQGKKSKAEIAQLTAELEARHAKELADLDSAETTATPSTATAVPDGPAAQKLEAADGTADEDGAGGGAKHMTKAMKRRAKQAAAEAEREARIAEELAAAGPSARAVEEAELAELLAPLGLRMREIRADGHCLYRSIEDQLTQLSLGGRAAGGGQEDGADGLGPSAAPQAPRDFLALRAAAADHIRRNPEQYVHFMDLKDGEAGEAALARYCEELEGSAVWGGQLELSVLADVLRRPIRVLAAGLPPLTLGEQHATAGPPLQVCYLRHAFGLGEHYNSLEPVTASGS